MFTKDIEDIMTLLILTVFADKKLYSEEIETFTSLAKEMEVFNCAEKRLSEAKMLIWFENNKFDLMIRLETSGFDIWFYDLLDRLAHVKDKPLILECMARLAVADDDVHISERALIVLTADHWNLAA